MPRPRLRPASSASFSSACVLFGQFEQVKLRELLTPAKIVPRDHEIANIVLEGLDIKRGDSRDDKKDDAGEAEPEPHVHVGEEMRRRFWNRHCQFIGLGR